MARFSVGGDEDDEGPSNNNNSNRRSAKKPRVSSDPIVYTPRRTTTTTASTSISGDRLSDPPPVQSERESRDAMVEGGSDEESEDESARSESPEVESEEEEEEEEEDDDGDEEMEQQREVQPAEARVDSSPNPVPFSVTLTDPDVLDCPICLEPLSPPVYQCENGHIACAPCCTKMRNKCASCSWPIGYNRCRAIEKVLESVRISCRNMPHGCKESLIYSKKLDHEKTCTYSPCSCPHPDCTFVGLPESLYSHFFTQHPNSSKKFFDNDKFTVSLGTNEKHVFLYEKLKRTLFVLNRVIEPVGSFVNVVCIGSPSSNTRFLYELSSTDCVSTIKLNTVAEVTPKWTVQPPGKKHVLIPKDYISSSGQLHLLIKIWKPCATPK